MGIFDFFKRKKIELELEETRNFKDINNYVNKKEQEIKENQKQPKEQIEQLLSGLLKELEPRIEVLKNVDLKERKAPERVKLIVEQNLYNFTNYLEKLALKLGDLNSETLESLINKINSTFEDFEKKSMMSFQKSTFLIGEELGKIGEVISNFFTSFNKIIKQNQPSIKKIKTISIIKTKLNQIDTIEKIKSENEKEILEINLKINSLKNQIQELKRDINEIKTTQEYLEQIKQKQELEKTKTKLIIEIQNLKDLIDFKLLTKTYHSIESKMDLIKQYKENFKETFEKYPPENLLDLVDLKEINKEQIKQKVQIINNLKQMINIEIKQNPTKNLENQINEINEKRIGLNPEILKKEKLIQKFQENKEKVKQEIIEKLGNMNVIIKEE